MFAEGSVSLLGILLGWSFSPQSEVEGYLTETHYGLDMESGLRPSKTREQVRGRLATNSRQQVCHLYSGQ